MVFYDERHFAGDCLQDLFLMQHNDAMSPFKRRKMSPSDDDAAYNLEGRTS